ncbi:hypothetical protein MALG_03282 [Marinovum algicola DG 898]|nr:hypothetical protein MALG_03282 [Marinovum algicola DG 898]
MGQETGQTARLHPARSSQDGGPQARTALDTRQKARLRAARPRAGFAAWSQGGPANLERSGAVTHFPKEAPACAA